jgi:hypothetical protein
MLGQLGPQKYKDEFKYDILSDFNPISDHPPSDAADLNIAYTIVVVEINYKKTAIYKSKQRFH